MSELNPARGTTTRVLVLDHYFGQDVTALRAEAGDEFEFRVIKFGLLRDEALRVFPDEVATGLEAFARPDLEPERREWERRTIALMEEQFAIRQFDAFLSPSDVFFYVRSAPEACHRLGVPFFVAQKETTIAPDAMESNSQLVRRYAPPIADHMTVCSEHHREFWLKAGAEPETVEVTGQPRFDVYTAGDAPKLDPRYGEGGPAVLFLSYQLDTYHPEYGEGKPVWEQMHHETERGLWELVERGWRVLIKPHPQQAWDADRRRLSKELGRDLESRVFLVDPDEDARSLIGAADVVLSFQTTGLLEGMLADTPVVYTDWDPEAKRLHDRLVPFHEWGDVITVVDAAGDLPDAVERAHRAGGETLAGAREIAVRYLGPADGGASRRTLDSLSAAVSRFESARSPEVVARREELAARRRPLALGRTARRGARYVQERLAHALER